MNAPVAFPDTKTRNLLNALAAHAFDNAGGMREPARASLIEMIRGDAQLKTALFEHILDAAASEAIAAVLHARRQRAWEAPVALVSSKDPTQRMAAFGLSNASRLLDFPLPDGTVLAKATGPQVREAAELYLRQSEEMHLRGTWLAAIAKKVGDAVVESVLGEEQVRAMREKAK